MEKVRRRKTATATAPAFYARYLAICKRVGVEPVSIERAREVAARWDRFFAAESTKATRPSHSAR